MIRKFIIILILVLLIPIPVLASDPVSDAASWAVEQGIRAFTYSIGDDIVALSTNVKDSSSVNRSDTNQQVVNLVTYNIDPYKLDFVKNWQKQFFVLYVLMMILIIVFGGTLVLITKMSEESTRSLAYVFGDGIFDFNAWIKTILYALFFLLFGPYLMQYLFEIQVIMSQIIASATIDTIPPVGDNIIAYVVTAICFLLLSIIMIAREVIIVIFVSGMLILFALYLIAALRDFVKSLIFYYISVLFLQTILIFVLAAGMQFMTAIVKNPDIKIQALGGLSPLIGVILILIMAYISIRMIFGVQIYNKVKTVVVAKAKMPKF